MKRLVTALLAAMFWGANLNVGVVAAPKTDEKRLAKRTDLKKDVQKDAGKDDQKGDRKDERKDERKSPGRTQ